MTDSQVIGDVGDLSSHDRALLAELLGAPSKTGALRRGFKVLPRILPYLRPYWKFAVISVILTLLLAVVALADPWPLAFVVDSIIGHKPTPGWVSSIFGSGVGAKIALAVVATLVLTALAGLMTVWNEYLSTTIDQRMVLDFRTDMFDHAQKLSLAFHDTESKGILMYRINNQAAAMGQIVISLPVVAQDLLTIIGMAYITVQINPLLALLALGTTPFVVYSTTFYTNRIEPRIYRVRGLGAINLAIVYEAMSMIRVVLAFGTQRREWRRFRTQGESFVNETIGLTVRQTAFKSAVDLIASAGTAAVIGVGAYQAVNKRITAGELLVVVTYIHQIYQPLEQLTTTIAAFQQQFIALLMSFDLMDKRPEVTEKPGALPLERARADIELDHVGFGYEARPGVLKDISIRIPAGRGVAVVGPTGAGKSTLASMLPRFYDPDEGTVRIDGHDVRDLKLADLREQFSIVLQEPLLFSGTIANNVKYGKPEASEEEMIEAAKAANAHEFISALPDGYETVLGERGTMVSGGERQRIAVARAFLRNAPILILDEPTSEIDSRTEGVILDALDRLMEGRTTILIAHRLSTLRGVDEILVMDDGEIVQQGSHEELADQPGLYKQLWDAQTRATDPHGQGPEPAPAGSGQASVPETDEVRARPALAAVPRPGEVAKPSLEPSPKRSPSLSLPRPKVVLLGMLTKFPVGGVAWLVGHHAAGFRRLGYEVHYVEAHSRTPSLFMTPNDHDGTGKAAAYVAKMAERFGLEDRWAYQPLQKTGRCYGMNRERVERLYRDAALIVNMHGATLPLPEHAATDRLVLLSTDPVDTELEVERGDKRALQFLDQHVAHFTWGLNYGNPDCRLPWASPYSFVPLPPPVVIDFWENAVEPTGPFTTIGNWRQAYRDIQFENRIYRWTKHQQFMRILDLPMRTDAPIELALSSYDGRDRLLLAEHGWRVRSALEFSQDPDAYHDYIVGSAGEISAAKEQNVHFRTGWFSERSAMYLAAGRPVIVQDTGFGAALPTGEGVFAFADLDEAVEAVAEVQADPARHRRAASDIAREYLSHEVVLGEMLDHVGLRPAVSRRKLPNSPAPAALPDELSLEVGSRRPFRLQDETAVYIAGRPVPAVVAPTGTPVVTVVVVARDNLACTRLTLESLLANTEEPPYEVIVVGGGSPEPSREYLEVLATRNRQVRLMSNDRGLSIAAGCNQGLGAAKSEICVLLDDDVVVTPKWLIDLVRRLDDPAIGFVAPATNRSRGTAEVPTSYTTWGELVRFSGRRRQELAGSPTRDIDVVDMSCVALRRGLFQAVGPLDARLENGSVADDYARRVRNSGHRVVCAAEIFAHRFDQASLGSLDDLSRSGDAPAEPSDPAAEGERTA